MSSLVSAVMPRDPTAATRTMVLVSGVGFLANLAWEAYALVAGRADTTPASAAGTLAVAGTLVGLALACRRAPERVPPLMYAAAPVLAVLLQLAICLRTEDASAAGQVGFVYAVVYAAAHFRPGFAWATLVAAMVGDAVVAFRFLPAPAAVGDVIVMGAALSMITVVLLTSAGHQADLVSRLNALATADPLTGLATRRELEASAARVLGGGTTPASTGPDRRGGEPPTAAALVLIDVDRFKDLNDTHGHPVGDAALVHVARLVRAAVRPTDTVARLGGDELAVLLPGSRDDAVARARAVHRSIRDTPLEVDGTQVRMTVSVGIAHGAAGDVDLPRLYVAADAALYRAKLAGRDTVVASPA